MTDRPERASLEERIATMVAALTILMGNDPTVFAMAAAQVLRQRRYHHTAAGIERAVEKIDDNG